MNKNWRDSYSREKQQVEAELYGELKMQAECVKWFDNTYPEERQMLHCNDNNSYNKIEGNRKKALGVTRGVSDLEYIAEAGVTWYIELKMPGETQSKEQIEFMNKVRARGHIYQIIYSLEEFKSLIWKIIGR